MKQIIYFCAILLVLVSLAGVSAMNMENLKVCTITNTMLTGNHLNNQVPHFECCDADGFCKKGNTIFKHLRLEGGSDIEAEVRANSYNGLDRVSVSLRVNGLEMNKVYTAWLADSSNNQSLRLGMFKTNKMGRGYVYMKTTVADFNVFTSILIKDSNGAIVSSGDLTFKTTSY